MRLISILCIGAIALLAMEIAYSAEIAKYETPRSANSSPRPAFFCGPITATLKSVLNLDAPAAPGPIRGI
jgi:CO dehydrogenase/acetyl-CoA synthase alpha subunit